MRNSILCLLRSLDASLHWVGEAIKFIESEETELLSEKLGVSNAAELIIELKIRFNCAKKADIKVIGMSEVIEYLETVNGNEIINNFLFKSTDRTGSVYLDKRNTKIIGVILVTTNKSDSLIGNPP